MTEAEQKETAQARLAALKRDPEFPQSGDVYRHHGGGLYAIVAVSIMQGTWDVLVTYRSNARRTEWTHTLAEFSRRADSGKLRFGREEA